MRNKYLSQICTLNLPMFAKTKNQKRILRLLVEAYEKSEEFEASEFFDKYETESLYVIKDKVNTTIILAPAVMSETEIAMAAEKIKDNIETNLESYFICSYL